MTKAAKLARKNDTLKALVDRQAQKIAALEEELRLALHKRFAASSEKTSPDQLNLFNEAEQTQSEVAAIEAGSDEQTTTIPEHER
jgi:transposase